MTLGAFVRSRRQLMGLTQRELAALCDVDPSYIGHIETGRIKLPASPVIDTLARALTDTDRDIITRPRDLLVAAGYMKPPTPEEEWPEDVQELMDVVASLSPELREEAMKIIRHIVDGFENVRDHYVEEEEEELERAGRRAA